MLKTSHPPRTTGLAAVGPFGIPLPGLRASPPKRSHTFSHLPTRLPAATKSKSSASTSSERSSAGGVARPCVIITCGLDVDGVVSRSTRVGGEGTRSGSGEYPGAARKTARGEFVAEMSSSSRSAAMRTLRDVDANGSREGASRKRVLGSEPGVGATALPFERFADVGLVGSGRQEVGERASAISWRTCWLERARERNARREVERRVRLWLVLATDEAFEHDQRLVDCRSCVSSRYDWLGKGRTLIVLPDRVQERGEARRHVDGHLERRVRHDRARLVPSNRR